METKTLWFTMFAASILGMIFSTNRASKHVVEDFDEKVKSMPQWKRWAYGLLDICPFSLLNSAGKKWQMLVYILLIPALLSGYQLGQMVTK